MRSCPTFRVEGFQCLALTLTPMALVQPTLQDTVLYIGHCLT